MVINWAITQSRTVKKLDHKLDWPSKKVSDNNVMIISEERRINRTSRLLYYYRLTQLRTASCFGKMQRSTKVLIELLMIKIKRISF